MRLLRTGLSAITITVGKRALQLFLLAAERRQLLPGLANVLRARRSPGSTSAMRLLSIWLRCGSGLRAMASIDSPSASAAISSSLEHAAIDADVVDQPAEAARPDPRPRRCATAP